MEKKPERIKKVIKKKIAKPRDPRLLNKRFVNKVAKALDTDDPPRQKDLASKCGVCQSTIRRTVKQDLDWKWKKKTTTHALTAAQAS